MGGRQRQVWASFPHSQNGATAVEYAIIAGLISVLIIGAVALIGAGVGVHFDTLADKLKAI